MIEGDGQHHDEEKKSSTKVAIASSSVSMDGSGRWSAGSRHGERPFEDDAFEKVTHVGKRQPHRSGSNVKKARLIKVLEDFLLRRTTGTLTKNNQPFDDNGREPIISDPLITLFEPIVEELAADKAIAAEATTVSAVGPTTTTVTTGRKKKADEISPHPLSVPVKRRRVQQAAPNKPESKMLKKKLLVNGKTFASKSKLTHNNDETSNGNQDKTVACPVMAKNQSAIASAASSDDTNANATSNAKKVKTKRAETTSKQTKKLIGKATSLIKSKVGKKTAKTETGLKIKLNMDFVTKNKFGPKEKMESVVKKTFTDTLKKVQEAKRRKENNMLATTASNEMPIGGPSVKQAFPVVSCIRKEFENKNEKVCQRCEKVDENLIRCEGICHGIFHAACIYDDQQQSSSSSPSTLKCNECITGRHSCFVCRSTDGVDMRQCSARTCGKFYHVACLSSFRAASFDPKGTFTCPLHFCLSCILLSDKKTARNRSRMYRCVRCPVAYHSSEACFAAGSVVLSSAVILCPAHHRAKKGKNAQINVNWCFVCSHGGSLICCETCPASFHAECLNIETPEGSYYCAECQSKSQPKYGDILWVKLGNYRWWPAKVCNPKNVPPNIKSVHHELGDFPVRFFGTYDYHWTRRSRTFQFLEGDHIAHTGTSNKLGQIFKAALEEALVAFQRWKSAKETRAAHNYEKNNLKPPQYKYLKTNKPVGSVSAVSIADPLQMTSCDCDPKSENPCGPNSECLNRLLLLECSQSTCPAGERCQNQLFVKQQYVKSEIFRTDGKGWGLKSLENIFKGQFVNEYVGEMIDENECKRRMKKMQEENDTAYYFLTLDKDRIIDAGKKGNLSRFMNHSCQPNCELRKWTVNGDTRVGLFALCDIATGTELTFNYNLECLGNEKTKCQCEAPNCSGFIGERPKTLASTMTNRKTMKSTSKTRRRKPRACSKANYDSECFRCGLDGELLLCDRKNCTKAFHLSCLKLEKTPHGRWECPWHHCNTCGKLATVLCSACPNSFCLEHIDKNVRNLPDGSVFCLEHDAIETLPSSSSNEASSETEEQSRKDGLLECGQLNICERSSADVHVDVAADVQETKQREKTVKLPEASSTLVGRYKSGDASVIENGNIVKTNDGCRRAESTDGIQKVVVEIALVTKKGSKQMNCPQRNGDIVSKHTAAIVVDGERRTTS